MTAWSRLPATPRSPPAERDKLRIGRGRRGRSAHYHQGRDHVRGRGGGRLAHVRAATIDDDVVTSGGQTYNGNVTLGSNVTLTDAGNGIIVQGTVTGVPYALTVFYGAATFDGAVTSARFRSGA